MRKLSVTPLDAFGIADGVDCEGVEDDELDEEEDDVKGPAEGNVSVGEADARLQNCWASFSSVTSSVGQPDSTQLNTS